MNDHRCPKCDKLLMVMTDRTGPNRAALSQMRSDRSHENRRGQMGQQSFGGAKLGCLIRSRISNVM